ncbi:MarR family transcriptional regulator [Candidatus Chlorohelix sp.]|uniref:MarR family winged helix-turn-helix transcriptional regulator n=1 Tax=Candidatus Chlorohelix sp. TaxID=3139201 RepID=UPI00306D26F8
MPNNTDNSNTVEVAIALLDLLPNLLYRLGQIQELNQKDESTWQDVSELRTTTGQLRLMRTLVRKETCKMQELAELLGVTPSTVTSMVKRLALQGYIERNRDDNDWRSVWVKPTERGQRALLVFDAARYAALQQRLEQLSPQELENIAAVLPVFQKLAK